MMSKLIIVALTAFCGVAWGYSGGAPEDVCEDMLPKHPVDPQKSAFPYTVTADKSKIGAGDKVHITISGGKPFKGYLLQVRDGDHAVGQFNIDGGDKHSKTINCFSKKQNAATHKNAAEKSKVTVEWVPPSGGKKTYTVYATVAENGGVFWVRQPTATISVN